MTAILSDAEYRRLSPAEQTDYWRGRYYDMAEALEKAVRRITILEQGVRKAREALEPLR